jgi:recombinational DNA repair protein RecT
MLAAKRRASSRVSNLAAMRAAGLLLEIDLGQRMAVVVPHDEAGRVPKTEAQLGYKRLIQL